MKAGHAISMFYLLFILLHVKLARPFNRAVARDKWLYHGANLFGNWSLPFCLFPLRSVDSNIPSIRIAGDIFWSWYYVISAWQNSPRRRLASYPSSKLPGGGLPYECDGDARRLAEGFKLHGKPILLPIQVSLRAVRKEISILKKPNFVILVVYTTQKSNAIKLTMALI